MNWDWDEALGDIGFYHEFVSDTDHDDSDAGVQGPSFTDVAVDPTNLAAWYPLQDPATITDVTNVAGSPTGERVNTPTVGATGLLSTGAYEFYPPNSTYVDTNYDIQSPVSPFSWMAWVYPFSIPSSGVYFVMGFNDGGQSGDFSWELYQIQLRDTGEIELAVNSAYEAANQIKGPNPNTNEWLHVCGVAGGGTHEFFVDGVSQGSDNFNLAPEQNPPIGVGTRLKRENNQVTANGNYWDGRIADVRFYTSKLSAAEVQEIYEQTATPGDWLGTGKVL